ncbi:hypothetical protein MMJ53_01575 [Enterococcus cecorum]|uniref:hypothetical protein n=1 Tax=Enterococcus cecorum TaxID=44008 RepID=UPI001FACB3F6|nr:hypothetical protein [Enterococcus cecorum]MCJ0552218.1 hypothetical protein [Enterococcus cecorum]MCJ0556893.1 hypothetical protein [Enterococcus cecorum]MCJ0561490.1 hypothetical protein [Enterococcus cecorum]
MEKTIQTLKLDNKELIEELQAICDKNTDIHRELLRKARDREVGQALNELSENNRKLIKVITILEYLEELEQ